MNATYTNRDIPVGQLSTSSRAAFIIKTYLHLLGAILAFVGIEMFLFSSGLAYTIGSAMLSVSWLLILGGFVIIGMLSSYAAYSARSLGVQYIALLVIVIAEALIFIPLLLVAELYANGVIQSAVGVTLLGFGGLTAIALVTRKDFSFLRGVLIWGGIVALVLIAAAVIFGFELGVLFSVAMVALAGVAILYHTSNILHRYPEDRYVGAALSLFTSVALLFWYVLRIFLSRE